MADEGSAVPVYARTKTKADSSLRPPAGRQARNDNEKQNRPPKGGRYETARCVEAGLCAHLGDKSLRRVPHPSVLRVGNWAQIQEPHP